MSDGIKGVGKYDALFHVSLPNPNFEKEHTLFPSRTWNTGPNFLANLAATLAWLSPNCKRLPNSGTPGISGRFLTFGVSVRFRYLTMKKMTAATAMLIVWYDIAKAREGKEE